MTPLSCLALCHELINKPAWALSAQTDSQHFSHVAHVVWSKPRKFLFLFLLPCGNGLNVDEDQHNEWMEESTSIST